jgi:hypothetical protein
MGAAFLNCCVGMMPKLVPLLLRAGMSNYKKASALQIGLFHPFRKLFPKRAGEQYFFVENTNV